MRIFYLILALLVAPQGFSESPKQLKEADAAYREYMVTISRQLGVTCVACHNTKNWSDDKKNEFKVAKHHIKLVQVLIDNGFSGEKGSPKADCYMCHRGKLKPDYEEPFHPMTMQKDKKKEDSIGKLISALDQKAHEKKRVKAKKSKRVTQSIEHKKIKQIRGEKTPQSQSTQENESLFDDLFGQ